MLRNSKLYLAVLFTTLLLGSACATSDRKDGGDDDIGGGGGGGGGGKDDDGGGGGGNSNVSSNRVTLTNSLSNNPLTSQTINSGRAEDQSNKLAGAKDKKGLEGKIAADRLSRKGVGQLLGSAKKLADLEMEGGAGRQIGDDVKLDIALSSITTKNFSMAEYYLASLIESKDARIRAGAYNAMGVVALKDERIPEAVVYFRQALKSVNNYRPALLNLGFTALMGGDTKTARQALGDLENDWFVQYGMISVARVAGDEGRASDLCDKVLQKEPGHRAALFNCGLLEYQNKRNFNKAKDLVTKAAKAKGGESGWESRAYSTATQIEFEEKVAKSKAATKPAAPAAGKPAAPNGGK